MSKRVLALVQRVGGGSNMTDRTSVIVYEHELAVLAEIHGMEPEVLEDYETLLDKSVKVMTLKDGTKLGREEILAGMVRDLGLGDSFSTDPQEEYDRLARIYGMHPEVRMPVVERVYGRFEEGRFAKALNVEALEDMPISALRQRCQDIGIGFEPKDKRAELIAAIRSATVDSATARELKERHERRAA